MACCFGRRRGRSDGSEHDVYLYPAAADGEVLFQYGGALRPELVYAGGDGARLATVAAGDAMAASAALAAAGAAAQGVSRRELDRCAPESVVGRPARRRRARGKLRAESRAAAAAREDDPAAPPQDCSICLDAIAKGDRRRTLPCSHPYHSACIQQWLASSIVCPVCMQNVVHRTPEASVVDDDTSVEM